MIDDLVKRARHNALSDMPHYASVELIEALADRIEELEAEVDRLRLLVPRPDQTEDEIVWRDHLRGMPLATLAKEFGCTKERMRYKLKRIAENMQRMAGVNDE